MKTHELSKLMVSPFSQRHKSPEEKKEKLIETQVQEERETRERIARMINEQIQKEEHVSQAVKEAIGEIQDRNLSWRNMRFNRLEKDGNDYVEIVDRISGEVLKTLPLPDYNKLANHFKQHPGLTLDITT